MKRFLKKILGWLRMFFVFFFEDDEDKIPAQPLVEEKREIAKPVELGISSSDKPAYQKKKSVLTYREKILFQAIHQAAAGDFTVLMKVRMGDFIFLANEPQERKFHNNQIQCKHVDFLLCDQGTLEPLLVIELDDSSHNSYDHAERDKFKDDTFDASGVPYIRLQIQEQYDVEGLKEQMHKKISDATSPR